MPIGCGSQDVSRRGCFGWQGRATLGRALGCLPLCRIINRHNVLKYLVKPGIFLIKPLRRNSGAFDSRLRGNDDK